MSAAILEAKQIGKRYGKFAALTGVNLTIARNTVHSVTGPNGAGKTTLFHVLTGTVPSSAGSIIFDGQDVTKELDHRRVKCGIARSFQVTSLFANLNVRENLRLAAQGVEAARALDPWTPLQGALTHREVIDAILERLALQRHASMLAGALSHGQQRHLEVGMALAAQPKAIFLDEPTSGMGIDDLDDMYRIFPRLKERRTNGGGQLSGGEQQMLAIGRALMNHPRLLMLDEPVEGLAPVIVEEIVAQL